MTENEAIKVFENPTKHITKLLLDEEETICYSSDMVKAFETAIQALEEIQKYRAIGTVEGYERAIETSIENYNLYKEYKAKVDELEAIGTIEEFKALKEKNEPKRLLTKWEMYPTNSGMYSSADRWCPSCKSLVFDGDWGFSKQKMMYNRHRCKCGQVLDWEVT